VEDRSRTVLLVEDDCDIREIVAVEVRMHGYDVIVAADAREAIDALEARGRVDLVLTDLTMPVLDGFALIQALRERESWREIPVLVLTAANVTERERAELRDAILLRKPIRLDALLEAIDAAVVQSERRSSGP
jgi:two-component system response regulator/two-component system chemotaxis response regulator CheY